MKIGIIGVGGIGGFIGAHLTKNLSGKSKSEVTLICRGETLANLKQKGLILKTSNDNIIVKPNHISNRPEDIGVLDVLFITVKSYSLREVINKYKEIIGPSTILIPLQNGVSAKEVIQQELPGHQEILEGCIYVASNVIEPGVIEHKGGPGKIYIGGGHLKKHKNLIKALSNGGLNISYEEDIKSTLWRKFIFVSPVAAITAAYKVTFGELLINENLKGKLIELMREVHLLAKRTGVSLDEDVITQSVEMLNNFPFDAKSSLQLDFEQGNENERETLIDFVIAKSSSYNLPARAYKSILDVLHKT